MPCTRRGLRVGEGLVGDIAAHARSLALFRRAIPSDVRLPAGNGEEIYNSLVGVPIVRSGRVIGVLVVQNKSRRHYTDEEVERSKPWPWSWPSWFRRAN